MDVSLKHFEVEQKFRVASLQPTLDALEQLGVEVSAPVQQIDRYYRHPQRDFSQTDEAFRLRSVGAHNCITYKGPKLDQETKTRCEEEVGIAEGDAARASCDAIIQHLGFEPVTTVIKHRRTAALRQADLEIEFALDQVDGLGEFVEIEIGVSAPSADDSAMDEAKQALAKLALEFGLTEVERRSYLELLLEAEDK